jgi:hypothetical protein
MDFYFTAMNHAMRYRHKLELRGSFLVPCKVLKMGSISLLSPSKSSIAAISRPSLLLGA